MIEILKEKKTIKFYGEIKVNKIKNVHKKIIDNLDNIKGWDNIRIDIKELEEADSSFYQLLISFLRSFKNKIRISRTKEEIEKDLSFYKLIIKS